MDPINYSIDVQSPFMSALQGYQAGAGIRNDQIQQQLQQTALAQQAQMRQDFAALVSKPNPTAQDYAALTLKYPQLKDQLKQSWEMSSADQRAARLDVATRAFAALSSGRPDVAEQVLRDRATAMKNSGAPEQEVKAQTMWADMLKASPDQAKHIGGLMLSAVMEPDKFADTFGKLGQESRSAEKAPAELAKANADATTAQADAVIKTEQAKVAPQTALLDLQKKGWDIEAIKNDIDYKKTANRIASMNAATARQGNDLKRQELELKVQQEQQKLDQHVRDTVAGAESAAANIDNSLNTIERIKKNPSLNSVLGSIQGRMPALLDDQANDAIALIDTLGSQTFLSQIPAMKGQGALSNAEGEKLQAALTNLSRVQSEGQFRSNLDEAARLMKKARENLTRKTGVPLPAPDTPAAPGSRPPLSSFQK